MAKKKRIAAKRNSEAKKRTIAGKKIAAKHNGMLKQTTPSKTGPSRLVIHTNDITKIMGINIRTAQRLLKKIKESLGRSKEEYVSVKEFSKFVHLDEKDVQRNLS
jgi:hypothetical protein